MPRQNDATELFKKLNALDLYVIQTTNGGDTVTTAAVSVSQTTVSVSATTSFVSGDFVFISGDGGTELNTVGTPATAMPVTWKTAFAQSAGARFVEAQKKVLGKINQGSTQIQVTKNITPIFSDIDDLAVQYIESPIEIGLNFNLLGWNPENMQLALGFADSVIGTGTPSDPYQGVIGQAAQAAVGLAAIRGTGVRYDGKTFLLDFLDAKFAASGSISLAKTDATPIPVSLKCTKFIFRYYT